MDKEWKFQLAELLLLTYFCASPPQCLFRGFLQQNTLMIYIIKVKILLYDISIYHTTKAISLGEMQFL